jgi:genome maintenance exonuclease 1
LGNTKPREFLENWKKNVGEEEAARISKRSTDRGTFIHDSLETLILDNKEPEEHEFSFLYKQVRNVLKQGLTRVLGVECPMYSDELKVAGRADLIGYFGYSMPKLSIIDYKTSTKFKKREYIEDYFLQATAYSLMFKERTKLEVEQIVIIIASEAQNQAQIFIESPRNYEYKLRQRIQTFCPNFH